MPDDASRMNGADWSLGYVTDASYTDTFFRELSPAWLNYVAMLAGGSPRQVDQPFTYLELGCGFAGSTIVNAGAFPRGEFHACDFNAAHMESAGRHAAALGIGNIRFHESSFQHLLMLNLPAFDFVVLHGVYSWVGAKARLSIRHLIHKTLKPGGLVYVSYNCLPGWSLEAPLRKLLLELSSSMDGDSAERTRRALNTMTELSAGTLRYFTAHPAAAAAVAFYNTRPANYVAHEFLNQAWEPFYSIDVADEMAEAGVRLLGSATLADNHQSLILDRAAADAVARLANGRLRQLATDFAVNRRFRRDVFVRSDQGPALAGRGQLLDAAVIGSLGPPGRMPVRARVPRGEITFQQDFISDLQPLMLSGSMTMAEIVDALGDGRRRNAQEIRRNLTFLVAAGTLMPFASAHRRDRTLSIRRQPHPMLTRGLALAIGQWVRRAIPSETVGNGVSIDPVEAVAITEWLAGADDVDTVAVRTLAAGRRHRNRTADGGGDSPPEIAVAAAHAAATTAVDDLIPTLIRIGLIT